MARTHVILPDEILDEIDERVGKRKRSEFIAAAAEKELKRQRRIEAARKAGGSLRDADTPPEWVTTATAAEWVRSIRRWPDPWITAKDGTNDDVVPS
jgi:Arc/MetJ-type ribon-helix-helix transcriptional regulator